MRTAMQAPAALPAPLAAENEPRSRPASLPIPAQQPIAPQSVGDALTLGPDEIATLVKRGKDHLMNGDISSARLLLRRAAEAGNAEAALALGSTFDPIVIQRLARHRREYRRREGPRMVPKGGAARVEPRLRATCEACGGGSVADRPGTLVAGELRQAAARAAVERARVGAVIDAAPAAVAPRHIPACDGTAMIRARNRARPCPTDGSAAGGRASSTRRPTRPKRSIAWSAYSEQVGRWRHSKPTRDDSV